MASRLSWLTSCKLTQLKVIANATGINSSGTKPVLTTRLLDELLQSRFDLDDKAQNILNATGIDSSGVISALGSPVLDKLPKPIPLNGSLEHGGIKREAAAAAGEKDKPHNLISIDMGIRNLAFCRLLLASSRTAAKPTLTHWTRIAISRKQSPTSPETPSEAFDPQTFAKHAYTFVTQTLLPLKPSHILIERQRFRSMGGSSVQEWTLRVNMFEAMLYAVLKTFKEQGLWMGDVYPISPAKVSKFWVGDGEVEEADAAGADVELRGKNEKKEGTTKPKPKSLRTKTAKITLVHHWLSHGTTLNVGPDAQKTVMAYIAKNQRGGRVGVKRSPKGEVKGLGPKEELGKLDDLADCLLQGMGWWEWERNRRKVLQGGMGVLDEL